VNALLGVVALLGLAAGHLVNRLAARFPLDAPRDRPLAVRPPVLELATAVLFVLALAEFGRSWDLPAYLFLAAAGVLLAVVDLKHTLLPNRIVLPSIGIGAGLLTVAAAAESDWPALLRAGIAGVVLFAVYLVMALISPRGIFMGDVKLAGLLGLYLGWLGWGAVVVGAAAGFVVQAVVAVLLLAFRRIGLGSQLPFGPSMLLGAALAIAWSDQLLH
jgi:leader peptidase (prepilin peptidase) / N-methyltransferase